MLHRLKILFFDIFTLREAKMFLQSLSDIYSIYLVPLSRLPPSILLHSFKCTSEIHGETDTFIQAVHIFITFYELRCNHLHSYWSIDSFSLQSCCCRVLQYNLKRKVYFRAGSLVTESEASVMCNRHFADIRNRDSISLMN